MGLTADDRDDLTWHFTYASGEVCPLAIALEGTGGATSNKDHEPTDRQCRAVRRDARIAGFLGALPARDVAILRDVYGPKALGDRGDLYGSDLCRLVRRTAVASAPKYNPKAKTHREAAIREAKVLRDGAERAYAEAKSGEAAERQADSERWLRAYG